MLRDFKNDNKIFGNQFLYEDCDLHVAFEKIHKYIVMEGHNHEKCVKSIKHVICFSADILRESVETM